MYPLAAVNPQYHGIKTISKYKYLHGRRTRYQATKTTWELRYSHNICPFICCPQICDRCSSIDRNFSGIQTTIPNRGNHEPVWKQLGKRKLKQTKQRHHSWYNYLPIPTQLLPKQFTALLHMGIH